MDKSKVKVMVVDDSKFTIKEIKGIVEKNGFNVIASANNGLEAVKVYQDLKPDIVTMDLTMPELDGISAIKQIKEIDGNANIIAVSALEHNDKVVEAIEAGCKEYIMKPVDERKLIDTIMFLAKQLVIN